MTVVNCPLCVLRFATKNERDDHVRTEHGEHHLHRGATGHQAPAPAPQPPPEREKARTP
jgi:hypothetical protein